MFRRWQESIVAKVLKSISTDIAIIHRDLTLVEQSLERLKVAVEVMQANERREKDRASRGVR